MKRFFNTIIFLLAVIAGLAAPVNKEMNKLRTDIYNFLQKERTNPQYVSDSKIMFSVRGTVYVISLSQGELSPVYLTLSSTFNLNGDYVPELVSSTTSQINNNKMVKFTNGDDWVSFQEEMYLSNASAFTSVFPSLISSLENARVYFENYYDEVAEEYEAAKKEEVANPEPVSTYTEVTQIHVPSMYHSDAPSQMVNGTIITTPYHDWECLSLQLDKDKTVLTKKVVPKRVKSSVFSSYIEYIEDAVTGKKYYLEDSEIGFEDHPEIIIDGSTRIFSEIYPALPASVKVINISGGSQYYVKNLKIR